jgi:hypothetical protein
MVFRKQYLVTQCTHCCWGVTAPGLSQCMELGNVYVSLCVYFYFYLLRFVIYLLHHLYLHHLYLEKYVFISLFPNIIQHFRIHSNFPCTIFVTPSQKMRYLGLIVLNIFTYLINPPV